MEQRDGPLSASVIIPAHNRTNLLRSTLASLERQSWDAPDFEVIVVDDGSATPVAEEIDAMERVTLLRHDRPLGAHRARNTGAAAARGAVLIFLDAECVAHPDLVAAHVRAQAHRAAAYCGYAAAREQTPQTWDLLVEQRWSVEHVGEQMDALLANAAIVDPLGAVLRPARGSDWAFFWTANASVPAEAFRQVGGFSGVFAVKGVEDMELGLRLTRHGVPTLFLEDAVALHLPHDRDRNTEVIRDRQNEQRMLERHPDVEVEAVTSFDISRARRVLPAIAAFAEDLAPESADCRRLPCLNEVLELMAEVTDVCLLGHPGGWPAESVPPASTIYPAALPGVAGHLRLVGTRLPFENDTFGLAVVTDYWRHFPHRTACRIVGELARIARGVIVLVDVSTDPPAAPNAGLLEALERDDRPYWETTVRLPREFHEFEFEPIARVGRSRAFSVKPRQWRTVEMSGALAPRL